MMFAVMFGVKRNFVVLYICISPTTNQSIPFILCCLVFCSYVWCFGFTVGVMLFGVLAFEDFAGGVFAITDATHVQCRC